MDNSLVYIDAATRTQDVLSLKWALRGVGYGIGSTWHDSPGPVLKPESHWNEFRVTELDRCNELFVIFEGRSESAANLAAMAAVALARGMQVTWIGPKLPSIGHFPGLRHFATLPDFGQQIRLPLAA